MVVGHTAIDAAAINIAGRCIQTDDVAYLFLGPVVVENGFCSGELRDGFFVFRKPGSIERLDSIIDMCTLHGFLQLF